MFNQILIILFFKKVKKEFKIDTNDLKVVNISSIDDSKNVFEVFVLLSIKWAILTFVKNGVSSSKRPRKGTFCGKCAYLIKSVGLVVLVFGGDVFTSYATVAKVPTDYLACWL